MIIETSHFQKLILCCQGFHRFNGCRYFSSMFICYKFIFYNFLDIKGVDLIRRNFSCQYSKTYMSKMVILCGQFLNQRYLHTMRWSKMDHIISQFKLNRRVTLDAIALFIFYQCILSIPLILVLWLGANLNKFMKHSQKKWSRRIKTTPFITCFSVCSLSYYFLNRLRDTFNLQRKSVHPVHQQKELLIWKHLCNTRMLRSFPFTNKYKVNLT